MNNSLDTRREFPFGRLILCITAAALLAGCAEGLIGSQQTVYTSPGEAVDALVAVAESPDSPTLAAVFGSGAEEVFSSGDESADAEAREAFLELADEGVSFEKTPGGQVILLFGAEKWPFPVALARRDGGWYFDTESGKEEILDRRVGRNEIFAAATCRAYPEAQYDYFSEGRDGYPPAFAQRIVSSESKHDGLYWPAGEGEPESPLGPLLAEAAPRRPPSSGGEMRPFHGYYYKILTAQGENDPGGAMDYVADGLMTGGFALVAWPARHGNSGVMTFVVNRQGVVYAKDLGPETASLAEAITAYDPDDTWDPVLD